MAKQTEIKQAVEVKNSQDMLSLIKRIDKDNPKPEDIQALTKELDKKPQVVRSIGNLQSQVFSAVLRESVSSNFVKECAERYTKK